MKKSNIKIFASDLDGTLLNDKKEISSLTLEAVKRVKEENKMFIITTGRPYGEYVQNLKDKLNLNNDYVVVFNGAMVYYGQELIYSCPLSKQDIKDLDEFASHFNVNTHIFTTDNELHIKESNKYSNFVGETNKSIIHYGDYNFKEDAIKFSIVADDDIIKDVINNIPDSFKKRFNIFRSYGFLLEFVNINVDKINAIKDICKKTNTSIDEVMTFGDEENDYHMVEQAGIVVTPLNGRDKLKKVAKIVCDDCNNSGVAKVILEYLGKDK